jgi:guanylate kinase
VSLARPVVLAAPSGTGKTTIAHRLVQGSRDFVFSVSATTRPPREGERNGMDYEFVTPAEFDVMRRGGELVEWAEVHGHMYGTPRHNIEEAGRRGEHVVLDIDVQGARQIRARVPDALLVFVLPPSAEALVERLTGRGTEPSQEVVRRLQNARAELSAAAGFDYLVVNDRLDGAVRQVREIVDAEAHRPSRMRELDGALARLEQAIDRTLDTAPRGGTG